MKKVISVLLILLLFTVAVAAQEEAVQEESSQEDIYKDIGEVELTGDAGLTPDSAFYFIDSLLESMLIGNDPGRALAYKEEKILEAREMVRQGNIEGAKIAFEGAMEYGDILEKEVSPELEIEARESSKAVKEVIKKLEIEGEEWNEVKELAQEQGETEDKIALTAKISTQIQELCQSLSKLDPVEYSRICKTEDDSPDWQKKLDTELTEEQKEEARKFGKIMSECFKTSGQKCNCEEIPFPEFAKTCSVAAPLATACDVKGDKEACERLDNLEMPKLPDHLQDIMDELDDHASERFDIHMPEECVEAGATTKEECSKVMIETNSPEECKQALLDSGCDSEGECRQICDKIMMEKHAPECSEKGITDQEECKRFMDSFRKDDHRDDFMIDFDCKKIEDPLERLECFDKAAEKTRDYHEDYEDIKKREKECATECSEQGGRWDFTGGDCKCYFDDNVWDDEGGWHGYECSLIDCQQGSHCEPDYGCVEDKKEMPEEDKGDRKEDCAPDELHICEDGYCKCTSDSNSGCGAVDCEQGYHCEYGKCFPDEGSCGDCSAKCPGSSRTDCIDGECQCYYEEKDDEIEVSECDGGCEQYCDEGEHTDCVDNKCVCLGYGENGPPTDSDGGDTRTDIGSGDSGGSTDTGSSSDAGSIDSGTDSGSTDSGSNTEVVAPTE